MRTGSEPRTARSALRARFWLSLWGLVWAVAGTVAFALAGRSGWAIACGVLLLVVTIDLVVVLRHIRQGPHYQPGPGIPPYRPVDDLSTGGRPTGHGSPDHGVPDHRSKDQPSKDQPSKNHRSKDHRPESPRPPENPPPDDRPQGEGP